MANLAENRRIAAEWRAKLAAQGEPDFSQIPEHPPLMKPGTPTDPSAPDFSQMPLHAPGYAPPVSASNEPDFSQMPMHDPTGPQAAPADATGDNSVGTPQTFDPHGAMPPMGLAQQDQQAGPVKAPDPFPPNPQSQSNFAQDKHAESTNNLNDAYANMQGANDLDALAQASRAKAVQPALDSAADDATGRAVYYEDVAKETQRRASEVLQKQAETVDQMSKMLQNQPKGIWGKSGVNPVVGSIGLALASFGPGATNSAMDAINHRIESNIADQKRQFEQLGMVAAKYGNVYADLHTKLGDDNLVQLTMKQLSLDSTKALTDAAVNRSANQTIQANGAKLNAAIDIEAAKAKNALNQQVVDSQQKAAEVSVAAQNADQGAEKNRIDSTNNWYSHIDRLAGIGKDIEVAKLKAKGNLKPGIMGLSGTEYIPDGAKEKLGEKISGGQKVNNAINDFIANTDKNWLGRVMGNEVARANLMSALRQAQGLSSRVSGPEGSLLQKMTSWAATGKGDWMSTFDPDVVKAELEHVRQIVNEDIRGEIHYKGVTIDPDSYLFQGENAPGTTTSNAKQTLANAPAN